MNEWRNGPCLRPTICEAYRPGGNPSGPCVRDIHSLHHFQHQGRAQEGAKVARATARFPSSTEVAPPKEIYIFFKYYYGCRTSCNRGICAQGEGAVSDRP